MTDLDTIDTVVWLARQENEARRIDLSIVLI